MIEHRFEVQARLEDGMCESGLDGSVLQLVTVCLSDDGVEVSDELGERVVTAPVVSHLRPSAARALAFCLLELAELADRRMEERE